MRKAARFLIIISILTLTAFSLLTFTVNAQEAPYDFTLYVKNGVKSWTGGAWPGQIEGNAIIESGVIPNPGQDPRVFDGFIYYMPDATFNTNYNMSEHNKNSFKPVTSDPFVFSSLVFADIPSLPPRADIKTTDNNNYTRITEDGYYNTIEVANNGSKGLEIVAPEGTVRKINIKTLILDGQIIISGGGKVILYVDDFRNSGNNNPSINVIRSGNETFGEVSQCAVYFYGAARNISLTNIRISANIYSKSSLINMDGSNIKTQGNIYALGDIIMGSTCDVQGFVFAPNSDITLQGNSTITGKLVANTVSFAGSGKIRLGGIYNIDKEVCPEGNGLPETGPSDPFKGVKPGILGTYYDSMETINNTAVRLMRIDDDIAWNWKHGSPDQTIEPETFSVKWTGYITVPKTGDYLFRTYSDDGVKLTVNGVNLINRWGLINLEFTTANQSIHLEENKLYSITLEYQQLPLNSTMFLFWESDDVPMQIVPSYAYYIDEDTYSECITPQYMNALERQGTGLSAKFYNGAEGIHSGNQPDYTETNLINYEFKDGTPGGATSIGDEFSTVITGKLEGKFTEEITLEFISDDGIRVWFDNKLIIDSWQRNNAVEISAKVNTTVGHKHSIRIEHNDLGDSATLIMRWYGPSQELEVVPRQYLYN